MSYGKITINAYKIKSDKTYPHVVFELISGRDVLDCEIITTPANYTPKNADNRVTKHYHRFCKECAEVV